jgi:hypothetical protein
MTHGKLTKIFFFFGVNLVVEKIGGEKEEFSAVVFGWSCYK